MKKTAQKHESSVLTYSTPESLSAREELFNLLLTSPATLEERERSLGLFIRSQQLARFVAINDLYKMIVDKPGIIMDVGTWRGQTAVLCENFRAIYEPLHFTRRIICFDTFEGYAGFGNKDKATDLHRDGSYHVGGTGYAEYLNDLLVLHEKNNAMGHNSGKHQVIAGDCRKTIPDFFRENAHEFVALAFFDVNAYEPTLDAFEAIYKRMVKGGICAFWQLSRSATPAEGRVYCEAILGKYPHSLHRSAIYPGLCYFVKE